MRPLKMNIICSSKTTKKWLVDWYLTPTLAVFQLYPRVNKCYYNLDTYRILKYKTYLSIKQRGNMYKYKNKIKRVVL